MKRPIIVIESGADLPKDIQERFHIFVVPMHVIMNEKSFADGEVSIDEIFALYKETGHIPTTSAVSPAEYREVFEYIREMYPDRSILHLCYSAVTTSTYQNALIASEDMEHICHVDTKLMSGGQAMLVKKVAEYLQDNPEVDMEELCIKMGVWSEKIKVAMIPSDLMYLKAGGRMNVAAYISAAVLGIKPFIEIQKGSLQCTKKYRGSMKRVCLKAVADFIEKYHLGKKELYLMYSEGLKEEIREEIHELVKKEGYTNVRWIRAGGVISTHAGPSAFGIVGYSE